MTLPEKPKTPDPGEEVDSKVINSDAQKSAQVTRREAHFIAVIYLIYLFCYQTLFSLSPGL